MHSSDPNKISKKRRRKKEVAVKEGRCGQQRLLPAGTRTDPGPGKDGGGVTKNGELELGARRGGVWGNRGTYLTWT